LRRRKKTAGRRFAAFRAYPTARARGAPQRIGTTHRITLEELVDAGEAMLLEMVRLARAAVRETT